MKTEDDTNEVFKLPGNGQPYTIIVGVAGYSPDDEEHGILWAYTLLLHADTPDEAEVKAQAMAQMILEQQDTAWDFMMTMGVFEGHHEPAMGLSGDVTYNPALMLDEPSVLDVFDEDDLGKTPYEEE
jgi:hypothetical protein